MKTYIFLTFGIFAMGGGQCYVAAKARYLETQGWKVFVFSDGYNTKKRCPIRYLDKYLDSVYSEISYPPCYMPSLFVKYTIHKMLKKIGTLGTSEEVIIESHNSQLGMWGEMLARRLKGRHFAIGMNEHYRGANSFYEDKMGFFIFKFQRGECFTSINVAKRMFEGYLTVSEELNREWIIDEDPVQDYENEAVNAINKRDWNICYIGRGEKNYVPNVINGIAEFASRHPNKQIQFINVGTGVQVHAELIDKVLSENKNLALVNLGNQTPLPRSLYAKTDVVIAGSGSARCSVEEDALTLVMDADKGLCNGLLGYETMESVYGNERMVQTSVADALDRVFVDKIHEKLPNLYPPKKGVDYCTQQNFEMIDKAVVDFKYYEEKKLREGKTDWFMFFKHIAKYIKYEVL